MKTILTNSKNVIIDVGDKLEVLEDRYQLDGNRQIMKEYKTQYQDGKVEVDVISAFEVELPEKVEPQKYCYTEKEGFYKNEEYREYYSNEQRIQALEEMMNELILGE